MQYVCMHVYMRAGLFCDGTRRYGVYWHLFFKVKKKQLFVMYIVNEYVISS